MIAGEHAGSSRPKMKPVLVPSCDYDEYDNFPAALRAVRMESEGISTLKMYRP